MTRRVDSDEKTLHTTFGNECKFSWDSKATRKTSMTITSLVIWRQTSFKSTEASFN